MPTSEGNTSNQDCDCISFLGTWRKNAPSISGFDRRWHDHLWREFKVHKTTAIWVSIQYGPCGGSVTLLRGYRERNRKGGSLCWYKEALSRAENVSHRPLHYDEVEKFKSVRSMFIYHNRPRNLKDQTNVQLGPRGQVYYHRSATPFLTLTVNIILLNRALVIWNDFRQPTVP